MAEVKGYPLLIFQGSNPDKKFLCGLCLLILRDPYQRYCGHRFCKLCLDRALLSEGKFICQQCIDENAEDIGQDVDPAEAQQIALTEEFSSVVGFFMLCVQMFPDKAIQREMAAFVVTCYACEWSGKFKEFMVHVESVHSAVSRLCQFRCGKELAPDTDLDEHVRNEVAAHFEVIWSMVTELESKVGSQSTTLVSPVDSQLSDRVRKLEARLSDTTLKMQNLSLEPSAAVGASTEDANVAEKMELLEGCLTVLNREVEGLSNAVDSSTRQRQKERELLDSIDLKVKNLERMIALKDATIVDLTAKVTVLEMTCHDGTLIWTITDVAKKRQDAVSGQATSIYSPPFYTSRTGMDRPVGLEIRVM